MGEWAELRVLTCDARHLRGGDLVRAVRAAAPDLVCVTGAPITVRWRTRCAELARLCGLLVVTGGRTAGGNLLLASLAVRVRFARDDLFPHDAASSPWSPYRHGAATAVVELRGATFAVAATRRSEDAERAAARATTALAHLHRPDAEHLVLTAAAVLPSPGIEAARPDTPADSRLVVADLRIPAA